MIYCRDLFIKQQNVTCDLVQYEICSMINFIVINLYPERIKIPIGVWKLASSTSGKYVCSDFYIYVL